MRSKLIAALGFTILLLFLSVQNAVSSLTVTTAYDYVQFTGGNPITYTGTVPGSYTISGTSTSGTASGSLEVTRGNGSLDYTWSATSALLNGVGIQVKDDFTLSGTEDFQFTYTDSYTYANGYLENTTTGAVIEKFGWVTGDTGPSPPFTISGVLASGNYELQFTTGALPVPPNGESESGEASIVTTAVTPIPGGIWLFGSGLVGLIGLKRKYLG